MGIGCCLDVCVTLFFDMYGTVWLLLRVANATLSETTLRIRSQY